MRIKLKLKNKIILPVVLCGSEILCLRPKKIAETGENYMRGNAATMSEMRSTQYTVHSNNLKEETAWKTQTRREDIKMALKGTG
jgi:hypothetical protein